MNMEQEIIDLLVVVMVSSGVFFVGGLIADYLDRRWGQK